MPFKFKLARRLARFRKLGLITPLLPLACVSGDKLVEPEAIRQPQPQVAQLILSPSETTVQSGQTVEFTAVGLTATGDTAPISVTWLAKRGTVTQGAEDKPGKRKGHYKTPPGLLGRDTVIVTDTSGNADTATVDVTDIAVAAVTVSPSTGQLNVGATLQLTAAAKDANGNTLTGRSVSWSSSATSVARVADNGVVTGVAAGSATVTATVEGKSGTAAITVTAVPVASVTVSPASASVEQGQTVQLTAVLKDANGNTLSGRSIGWSSSAAGVATVSSEGLVRGVAEGSATITATAEGKSGTAAVTVTAPPPPPPPGSEYVLVGAGDIASCSSSGDEATAALLDNIPGTIFTAGDNAYPDGTTREFNECYHPSWGRHKSRTRPSPGNHDYHTDNGGPYYAYFGAAAGPAGRGYYSYDLGDWHVIALNSEVSMSAGSAQEQWLRADLAATTKQCVVAYMHRPRFSSGSHGSSSGPKALWEALYAAGAEIVIAGHDHTYERFAPQTPDGAADPARGIRQFVAGTGGKSVRSFGTPERNSEVRYSDTYGVLKLTLRSGGYSWEFIPTSGSFRDTGTGSCH